MLLVEDEADLTLIVADTLRGLGYDVITAAADGVDGWRNSAPRVPISSWPT